MLEVLRPVVLNHYLETSTSLGIREHDVLQGTGIRADAATEPDYLIGIDQYRGLFENMARFSSASGIGLDIGLRSELSHFGVSGQATPSCSSVRQSMEDIWVRFGESLGMMAKPCFDDTFARTVAIGFSVPLLTEAAYRLCIEEVLCWMAKLGAAVAGEKPTFEKILLDYPEPEYGSRYREIFKCPVHFRAGRTLAIVDRGWLEKTLAGRDEALHAFYLGHLGRMHQTIREGTPMLEQVKEVLLRFPGGKLPTQSEVAQLLGLTARTFSRMLQREGTTFRTVIDHIRIQSVRTMLSLPSATSKELAWRAGYADVNAFRRAFKTWTGETVSRYHDSRQEQRPEAGSPAM